MMKEFKSKRTGESYFFVQHDSGLKIFLYEKPGFSSTYALFGTKYGSIGTTFKKAGEKEPTRVPDGIAHYLEHKLFESEDGDAFAKYAKTGASANAFTSFDNTCYLFSCTENLEESLKILMEFVQDPYFTDENVEKERGIISQEIKMYDDDPAWRVMFNLLEAMYHNHPVRVDIAGSIESIAKICPENLHECYRSFYSLKNMVLCVAGNIDKDEALKVIKAHIGTEKNADVPELVFKEEPYEVVKERVEQHFEISMPMFQFGFKEKAVPGKRPTTREAAETDILLYAFASETSPLYRKLLDAELINDSFSYEHFEGDGYASVIFSGESKDPDKAAQVIKEAVKELHRTGVLQEDFDRARRVIYGRNVALLNSSENIANAIVSLSFVGRELFETIDSMAGVTLDGVNERLKSHLDAENCALSVVLPQE